MRFITDVPVDQFIALLKRTACLVGNSSAGIKECSYLGTPVVDVGGRQEGRLRAANVVHAAYDIEAIKAAVAAQLRHGRYPASDIYYRPGVSQTMVDILARVPLYTQKRFHENIPANARIS
jgi:UDP-N-acetylglucosamine 2-epimerase